MHHLLTRSSADNCHSITTTDDFFCRPVAYFDFSVFLLFNSTKTRSAPPRVAIRLPHSAGTNNIPSRLGSHSHANEHIAASVSTAACDTVDVSLPNTNDHCFLADRCYRSLRSVDVYLKKPWASSSFVSLGLVLFFSRVGDSAAQHGVLLLSMLLETSAGKRKEAEEKNKKTRELARTKEKLTYC